MVRMGGSGWFSTFLRRMNPAALLFVLNIVLVTVVSLSLILIPLLFRFEFTTPLDSHPLVDMGIVAMLFSASSLAMLVTVTSRQ